MSSTFKEVVSQGQLHAISYAMITLSSLFVITRLGIQIWKHKRVELQDLLSYFSYILFVAMAALYITIFPKIYMISRVVSGLMAAPSTMQEEYLFYMRIMFVTTTLFWLSLWSVKLSLLVLYKSLLKGLPAIWMWLWWGVFTFCILSLLGCITSYITSCADFGASMKTGECSGARSLRGQLASLYTSYAVDIVTDFMILALPVKLVWNLQMARGQKIAVIALFASGFICIVFATLRVAQIGTMAGESSSPSPSWLAVWTMVECSVAVCIGCCPSFAVLYCAVRISHVSYDTQGYVRHPPSRSGTGRSRTGDIKMHGVSAAGGRPRVPKKDPYWDDTRSSQEELAPGAKAMRVTTTLQQDDGRSSRSNTASLRNGMLSSEAYV